MNTNHRNGRMSRFPFPRVELKESADFAQYGLKSEIAISSVVLGDASRDLTPVPTVTVPSSVGIPM